MENKENKIQEPAFNGWRDAKIDESMPIVALVQFMGVLNQRLILIEDSLSTEDENGERISLTEYWTRIQKQEYQKMLEEMQKEQEKSQSQAN